MFDPTELISEAVTSTLGTKAVRRLDVVPSIDSEGKPALDVTVVLDKPDLSGAQAISVLVNVHDALSAAGDDRFPIIDYTTEVELALDEHSQR